MDTAVRQAILAFNYFVLFYFLIINSIYILLTILSFDSMLGSSGGVVIQPALGRAADVWGYGTSYLFGAAISALALPFVYRSRAQKAAADAGTGPDGPSGDAEQGPGDEQGGAERPPR